MIAPNSLDWNFWKVLSEHQDYLQVVASEVERELRSYVSHKKSWITRKKNEHDIRDATTEQLKAERGMAA